MSHLDEGQLHALLDGELDEDRRRAAEAHLAACDECRRLFDEARAFMAEADQLIAAVDLPPAAPSAAPPPAPAAPPLELRPPMRRLPWRTLAWAASLVLATGLGWYASELRVAPAAPAESLGSTSTDTGNDTAVRAAETPVPATTVPSARADAARTPGPTDERKAEADRATSAREGPAPAPSLAAPEPAVAAPAGRQLAQDDRPAEEGRARDRAAPPPAPPLADRLEQAQAPAPRPQGAAGFAAAAAPNAAKSTEVSALRQIPMEEGVRILGGTIRLLDGVTPNRVLTGPGRLVPGADPAAELVRVVYSDPPGRELWLDQQRIRPEAEAPDAGLLARRANRLLPGDTLITTLTGGRRSLQWITQGNIRLTLSGFLPADSLQLLARQVQ